MTLVRDVVNDAAVGVAVAGTPDGLAAIHHPGCAATIWRREPARAFQRWIDALPRKQLPQARITLRPNDVRDAVHQLCEASQTPDCAERTQLIDDVAALAQMFAALMQTPLLRLRLDAVSDNMCQKFHIDALTARLICTYRGVGTQYGIATERGEPRRIFTVPTGAPIVLRGTLWPQQPPSGLLHRSPPIEGTGQTRLVLVLDPVEAPDDVSIN